VECVDLVNLINKRMKAASLGGLSFCGPDESGHSVSDTSELCSVLVCVDAGP